MTLDETIAELEALGTEQNRKIYRRHGAGKELYGVSFANLEKLRKRIGVDQELAQGLWATGNADARSLATLIADPDAFSSRDLDRWLKGVDYHTLVAMFVKHVAARSRFAREKADRWSASDDEWLGQAGWDLVGSLAASDPELADEYFEERLETIERSIASAPNRTRYGMNGALINIGARNEVLREKAVAAADRIGTVEVDHGETGCKTPAARPYIEKMWARAKPKAASAA